ncbi:MAG: phytanoyl-CoA dioxygenase family protein [Actinomycetota bacterium]
MTDSQACNLDDFRALVETPIDPADYPLADRVELGAVVYEMSALADRVGGPPSASAELRNEIAAALDGGPGIIVLAGGFDPAVIDRASGVYFEIIERERAVAGDVGDHFAKAGANDRVWNALEKLAVTDPEVYVDYYANEALALGALSWLGPAYAVTSQVNVVNPGGEAQVPHRDYHLGFMTDERAAEYPRHAHRVSPVLTLQGAIAHGDMPIETGPTMYLPGSQRYELGYLAWRRPEFAEYFAEHHVQLALRSGDVVFFNPALFHGAGTNRTGDVRRMANLLQISSAMGIALEAVDRRRMVEATYGTMAARLASGADPLLVGHAAAATAQGYAFPTNLDRDQPVGGLTPPSMLDLVIDGLARRVPPAELRAALAEHAGRRLTH